MLKQAITRSVEAKIREFGHFTHRREITRKVIAVPYGASEMLMYSLKKKMIDCTVTVCDCAGTVITDVPEVVQGIGSRMNGIFFTSPVRKVINELGKNGAQVIFPKTAAINQEEGIKSAAKKGYKRIAVTVNGFGNASLKNMRLLERRLGISVTILTVCTTGVTPERAKELAQYSDLVWSCASKHIRNLGQNAILQITSGIPVFVFTQRGLDFVSAYCEEEKIIQNLNPLKKYFISSLNSGKMIMMGKFMTYLTEVINLPVRGKKEPIPLL